VLLHCTDTLCTHNVCTLDFGFSQSLHSRLCTLRLHSRLCILALSVPSTLHSRVLHSNTFFILALSVLSSLHSDSALSNCALIVHCAPSRLCALALSALSTLHSRLCTLTLHSQLCTLDSVLSHCTLVSVPRTVISSCTLLPPLDSVPLHSLYSQHCTLDSALSTLDSRTLCTLDPLLSSLHSDSAPRILLSSCILLPPLDSGLSHSLHSRL
jgi:hypothetical protein